MSTCFDLFSHLRLTRYIVAVASRCWFNPHIMPQCFAALWIPKLSGAVLTAAYSSLSAVGRNATCCFLVHASQQCPPMITPADTDRRVDVPPPQCASEHASSSPLCCQQNTHSARGFPTTYLPTLLTHSKSNTDGFDITQHICIYVNLRSGRFGDK